MKAKQKINVLREHIAFQDQQIMLIYQTLQHWGVMQQDQEGHFFAIFDPDRNIPCSWLNTKAHCENAECNWHEDQCVFTGLMKNCDFYQPMVETVEQKDAAATSTKTP